MLTLLVILLVVFAAVFAAVTLVVLAFAKPRTRTDLDKRLARAGSGPRLRRHEPRPKTAPLRVLEARLKPFAAERLTAERESALLGQLRAAGDYETTPAAFVARQLASAIVLPGVFVVLDWGLFDLPSLAIPVGLVLAVVAGYKIPASRLAQRIAVRQRAILRQLPTTLDLLTTCVEAGMTLQAAMQKIIERMRPHPLREELERTLKEIQLGRPRTEALRDLGRRVHLKELNSVAIAMVQAETMGASIAKTLRVQSEAMREARWQRAQEIAQKAPLKLVFPITFLIFPVIFLVIFGPLVIDVMTGKT